MKTKEAADYFGGVVALAKKIGLTRNAIYKWGEYPPLETQYMLLVLSGGALSVTLDKTKDNNK